MTALSSELSGLIVSYVSSIKNEDFNISSAGNLFDGSFWTKLLKNS